MAAMKSKMKRPSQNRLHKGDNILSKVKCFACRGSFVDIEGPVHKYMRSSVGCWAAFGEVLAREYSDAAYFEVHRLTVDAYAVQHPGEPSKQTIGSIGVHLMRLCLFHEKGLTGKNANAAMLGASKHKSSFVWLEPPVTLGSITVADLLDTKNIENHKSMSRKWAKSAWDAWSDHHSTIRIWLASQ